MGGGQLEYWAEIRIARGGNRKFHLWIEKNRRADFGHGEGSQGPEGSRAQHTLQLRGKESFCRGEDRAGPAFRTRRKEQSRPDDPSLEGKLHKSRSVGDATWLCSSGPKKRTGSSMPFQKTKQERKAQITRKQIVIRCQEKSCSAQDGLPQMVAVHSPSLGGFLGRLKGLREAAVVASSTELRIKPDRSPDSSWHSGIGSLSRNELSAYISSGGYTVNWRGCFEGPSSWRCEGSTCPLHCGTQVPGKLISRQSSHGSIASAAFRLLVTEIPEDVRELPLLVQAMKRVRCPGEDGTLATTKELCTEAGHKAASTSSGPCRGEEQDLFRGGSHPRRATGPTGSARNRTSGNSTLELLRIHLGSHKASLATLAGKQH